MTVVSVSPSTFTVSLSKKRRKKCSTKMLLIAYVLCMPHLHDIHHLPRYLLRVGVLYQLRKHAFERG